jgi:hypothetical protein
LVCYCSLPCFLAGYHASDFFVVSFAETRFNEQFHTIAVALLFLRQETRPDSGSSRKMSSRANRTIEEAKKTPQW